MISIPHPHLIMQVKSPTSKTGAKPQVVPAGDSLTKTTNDSQTITAFVEDPSERSTTATSNPREKITETASLSISHSMSTIFD